MGEPIPGFDFHGMKKWDAKKKRWHGVICRVESDDEGQSQIVVYDVEHKPTEAEIDEWVKAALENHPWETT